MPSLVITKNSDVPRYGDWAVASKRQDGQVIAGNHMKLAFGVSGTNVKDITVATLNGCWSSDCSIWMRYDGDRGNSFAIVEPGSVREDESENDAEGLRTYNLKLDYYEVEGNDGDPVQPVAGTESKLTLKVNEDSVPGKSKNKTMNVTIPSDFAVFDDQYLKDMTGDIDNLPISGDVPYLLSSLTFRRCL